MRFKSNLPEVEAAIQLAYKKALTATGEVVESAAKPSARVDTGQMRSSIEYRVNMDGKEKAVYVGVLAGIGHSIYNEFGTGEFAENGLGRKGGWVYKHPNGEFKFTYGMRPQPFLRPAFRNNADVPKRLLEKYLRQI